MITRRKALDGAIFALSTLQHPDASKEEDLDWLDEHAEEIIEALDAIRTELPAETGWQVIDNVTDQPVSKVYAKEDHANATCYALNLEAGPGGRYGTRQVTS